MVYLGLLAGFVILLVSGDLLVRGAVALAVRLGVPVLVIGLTVVAFGTSAPELVVSIRAATTGATGIAIGNIVGSNIANILLVLGLPALIRPTDCNQDYVGRNTCYVVGASVIFVMLCFMGPLQVWHGTVLFTMIVIFLFASGRRAALERGNGGSEVEEEGNVESVDGVDGLPATVAMLSVFIVAGLVGLPFGAHLVVDNATEIARTYGISEAAIGLTIIALGTSLPELATTMAAALRGQCAIAIGNVLGSNLFNMLAIMGLTAIVAPIPVPEVLLRFDLWFMLAATLAIVPFVIRRSVIKRAPAMGFLVAYSAYIFFVLSPGREATALVAF